MEWTILNNISLGNKITSYFTANWSDDGRIFVVTDTGATVFKFDFNFTNHENTLHFIKTEVKVSEYHVANETSINMDDYILSASRENMYTALINYNLTPTTNHAHPITLRPINAVWSPVPQLNNKYNVLLVLLSNTGNVEIYEQNERKWKLLTNVTKFWVEHLKKTSWLEDTGKDSNYMCKLHAQRVEQSLATCFGLSKIYYDENDLPFYFIAIGYATEYITVWKYYFSSNKTEPIFVNAINTKLTNLTTIFICSLNNIDWIVLGNIDGIVKVIPILNFSTNSLKCIDKFIEVWSHKDIRVSKVFDFKLNEFLCLLIIKGSFIVLSVLNDAQKLVCVKHINVKNLNITGIVPHDDTNSFVISTLTGIIKLLKVNEINGDFSMNLYPIKTDLKWDYHACYALLKSPGKILWGVLTYPCKMTDHLIVRNAIQIHFLTNINFDPNAYLKNQNILQSNYVTECIDILRCYSSKNNTFPNLWLMDYEKYDELSVRELKIIMWTSEFCQAFITKKSKFKKQKNPLPPPEVLRALLFFKFRMETINKILNETSALTEKQQNSLYLLYDALIKYEKNENYQQYFGEKTTNEMERLKDKMKNLELNTDIQCLWCGDKLTSEPCATNHPDQRCCITGVQISGIAKIECEKCSMPVDEHIANTNDVILCPLCDVFMTKTT